MITGEEDIVPFLIKLIDEGAIISAVWVNNDDDDDALMTRLSKLEAGWFVEDFFEEDSIITVIVLVVACEDDGIIWVLDVPLKIFVVCEIEDLSTGVLWITDVDGVILLVGRTSPVDDDEVACSVWKVQTSFVTMHAFILHCVFTIENLESALAVLQQHILKSLFTFIGY